MPSIMRANRHRISSSFTVLYNIWCLWSIDFSYFVVLFVVVRISIISFSTILSLGFPLSETSEYSPLRIYTSAVRDSLIQIQVMSGGLCATSRIYLLTVLPCSVAFIVIRFFSVVDRRIFIVVSRGSNDLRSIGVTSFLRVLLVRSLFP